jgi:hypothetical protein
VLITTLYWAWGSPNAALKDGQYIHKNKVPMTAMISEA